MTGSRGGQVIPAGQAAHRLVVVRVDGGQPRDERIVQGVELCASIVMPGSLSFANASVITLAVLNQSPLLSSKA